MNKFKKIMLGALSVLTLGLFVVTGTKANAATNCSNSTVSSGTMAKGTTYVLSASTVATAEGYDATAQQKTFTKPYYQYFTLGISSNWNVDYNTNLTGGVGIRSNGGSGRTVSFTIPGGETATVTLDLYTNDKSKTNTLSYGTISKACNAFTSNYVVETESTTITAGASDTASTITFANKIGFTSIKVEISGTAASEDDKIAAAEAAITAIGTVEYTTASQTLINAAAVAIADVTDPSDNITNYSTYTAAVTAFNNLESAAISTFTTAVTNIGIVSSSSGDDISAAETAYDALLASTKTNATVVSSKEILDAAKLAYADAIYDTLDKFYETPDSIAEATLTADEQLGNSIFTATKGMSTKDGATLTIGSDSWNTRYYTNGNSTCTTSSKDRLIYFTAKKSGTLKIAATSQNATDTTRKVDVYNESCTKIASISAQLADSNNTYIYVNIPSSGKYYIGSTKGVNFFYLEFMPETNYVANDVALTFEAQYNEEAEADSTKLRFIGTIEGIAYADYANIDTMKFTFTFNGTDRTVSVNRLYKSINSGDTVIKSAADKKMYVVYQLNNINKTAYQGKSLTNCKFIVTFTDGSTVSVNRADITLPAEFTSVVA